MDDTTYAADAIARGLGGAALRAASTLSCFSRATADSRGPRGFGGDVSATTVSGSNTRWCWACSMGPHLTRHAGGMDCRTRMKSMNPGSKWYTCRRRIWYTCQWERRSVSYLYTHTRGAWRVVHATKQATRTSQRTLWRRSQTETR